MENRADIARYGIAPLTDVFTSEYGYWKDRMIILLRSKNLLSHIENDDVSKLYYISNKTKEEKLRIRQDEIAQNLIIQHVNKHYIWAIQKKTSAYKMWNKIYRHAHPSIYSKDKIQKDKAIEPVSTMELSNSVFRSASLTTLFSVFSLPRDESGSESKPSPVHTVARKGAVASGSGLSSGSGDKQRSSSA